MHLYAEEGQLWSTERFDSRRCTVVKHRVVGIFGSRRRTVLGERETWKFGFSSGSVLEERFDSRSTAVQDR